MNKYNNNNNYEDNVPSLNNNNNNNNINHDEEDQHEDQIKEEEQQFKVMVENVSKFVEKIDSSSVHVRNLFWSTFKRESLKKANHTNIENQLFKIDSNKQVKTFFQSLISNEDHINYHTLQLIEKSISILIESNKNIFNNTVTDASAAATTTSDIIVEESISSNIILTSSLWGYGFSSTIQQLALLNYWLPTINKLSKQQKKKIWQTCMMFPLFSKMNNLNGSTEINSSSGYFKTPDYTIIIGKWIENPLDNLNTITIFFSAIGYLIELGLLRNEFHYPQSNVLVFQSLSNSTTYQIKQEQYQQQVKQVHLAKQLQQQLLQKQQQEVESDIENDNVELVDDEYETINNKRYKKDKLQQSIQSQSQSFSTPKTSYSSYLIPTCSSSPIPSPKNSFSFYSNNNNNNSDDVPSLSPKRDLQSSPILNNNRNNTFEIESTLFKLKPTTTTTTTTNNNVQSINSLIDNVMKKGNDNNNCNIFSSLPYSKGSLINKPQQQQQLTGLDLLDALAMTAASFEELGNNTRKQQHHDENVPISFANINNNKRKNMNHQQQSNNRMCMGNICT